MRKIPLVNDCVYHIFSKSIAKYVIFRDAHEYERMRDLLRYYNDEKPSFRFSSFCLIKDKEKFFKKYRSNEGRIVQIIAYCLMPTHLHLVLKQMVASKFILSQY